MLCLNSDCPSSTSIDYCGLGFVSLRSATSNAIWATQADVAIIKPPQWGKKAI